ncbi:MAG: helix-turn-helix transcriptional regulator [Actinobacteria bacterium]|nr:helix-turn-helix transcriptional regulator [Actinomycetota bacterium]
MLSNTAYVILGLLQKCPLSGYDIKSHVDISTSFFFSASYGQIYPELKRLEKKGLVEGTELATGRRTRTEYAITAAGQAAFDDWLAQPSAGIELRDEGLLKFFFGGGLDRDALLDKLAKLRAARAADLARVHEVGEDLPEIADELQREVLDYGIGLYEYVIGWCDQMTKRLAARPETDFPVDPNPCAKGD